MLHVFPSLALARDIIVFIRIFTIHIFVIRKYLWFAMFCWAAEYSFHCDHLVNKLILVHCHVVAGFFLRTCTAVYLIVLNIWSSHDLLYVRHQCIKNRCNSFYSLIMTQYLLESHIMKTFSIHITWARMSVF